MQDMLVVLEEGNHLLPRCPKFNILVPWRSLNRKNQAVAMCNKGAERKLKRLR